MSTDFNARIEYRTKNLGEEFVDQLLDAFAGYGPAVGAGDRGWAEAFITVPATNLRQAISTSLALAEVAAPGVDVLAIEVLPTDEFDARNGLVPLPELVSVSEAAAELGVSRQAVLQRLEAGTLAGRKVGNAWVIQRGALGPAVNGLTAASEPIARATPA